MSNSTKSGKKAKRHGKTVEERCCEALRNTKHYDNVCLINGTFDIVAWKKDEISFIEIKWKDKRLTKNQTKFIREWGDKRVCLKILCYYFKRFFLFNTGSEYMAWFNSSVEERRQLLKGESEGVTEIKYEISRCYI